MSAQPDHYSVLGVSSDASDAEVARQARRFRTEFHPDKFSRDAAAQQSAEAAFKRASDAREVLADPAQRAIYDRFGHEGVQEARNMGLVGPSTALSTSLRSPAETVEKYALNRRLRKEKELESDLGVGGTMTMRLDAARLFAPPRAGESVAERLGSVEVGSMDMNSNVYVPLGERDTGFLQAYLGVRGNGTGGGNFMGVWTRQWTSHRSSDVTAVVGDALSLGCRSTQMLSPKLKGLAGLTVAQGAGLTCLLGAERELTPAVTSKLQVELGEDGPQWSASLSRSENRRRLNAAFKINPTQLSLLTEGALVLSAATRVHCKFSVALPSLSQLARLRGRAMYYLFNYPLKMLRCELGARQQLADSNAAANVALVGALDGVTLNLAYERGPQKVAVPLSLAKELSLLTLGTTLCATAALCLALKLYVFDPRAESALKEALARSHAAHAEAMAASKSEADSYQKGLAERARALAAVSAEASGLVIHRAVYGVLPPQDLERDFEGDGVSVLEPEPEPEPEPEVEAESEPEPGVGAGRGCWRGVVRRDDRAAAARHEPARRWRLAAHRDRHRLRRAKRLRRRVHGRAEAAARGLQLARPAVHRHAGGPAELHASE